MMMVMNYRQGDEVDKRTTTADVYLYYVVECSFGYDRHLFFNEMG